MEQSIELEEIIMSVENFCFKWNEIETDIENRCDEEDAKIKQENPDNYYYIKRTDFFKEFMNRVSPLFDTYCTNKERKYGGKNIQSFGFPTKYNGVPTAIEKKAEPKNKNRVEVYFKTNTMFEDEYLFVVLKQFNQWRIDSYKQRRYKNEKWKNEIL